MSSMTIFQKLIYQQLLKRPGEVYVSHDENRIYAALDGGLLIIDSIKSLKSMTDAEINELICASLSN